MTSPRTGAEAIPADVMEAAAAAHADYARSSVTDNLTVIIARAIMAERERRAAKSMIAVEAIFEDLRDRRFLKWLFSERGDENLIGRFDDGEELRGLDLEVQAQIKAAWQTIIAEALSTPARGEENAQ